MDALSQATPLVGWGRVLAVPRRILDCGEGLAEIATGTAGILCRCDTVFR